MMRARDLWTPRISDVLSIAPWDMARLRVREWVAIRAYLTEDT